MKEYRTAGKTTKRPGTFLAKHVVKEPKVYQIRPKMVVIVYMHEIRVENKEQSNGYLQLSQHYIIFKLGGLRENT